MNPKRLLDLFVEAVQIESPSRNEAAMAAWCEQKLVDLGFEVSFDNAAEKTGSNTGNLIARRTGEAKGQLVLSAHLDTVEPCENIQPIVENGIIRSAGDTILSADDKAGIVGILEGVRSLIEAGEALPDIMVVFTTCEELSLLGSGAMDSSMLPAGAPCYVLDADGTPGSIILGAPCHFTFHATFTGRAAHAGVEPEAGVSAIGMAAAAIDAMQLGRLDEASTANVGLIKGGREVNVVADKCEIEGECRSLYRDRAEKQRAAMTTALEDAAQRRGGSVEVVWRKDYDAVLYEESDPLVQGIVRAAQAAGLVPRCTYSGGGADANILAACGVRAITLGNGMTNFHSVDEHISVADLEGTARLVEELIKQEVFKSSDLVN